MIERKCQNCKTTFMARQADVDRGWAKFCSKSCKAKKQEKRTGQMAAFIHRNHRPYREPDGTFQMSQEELNAGGYGDADWNTPFHDGKL